MLILFAPLLLFGTALALTILHFIRPRFRFHWLASFISASLACVTVLLWQLRLPTSTTLPGWEPALPFSAAPTFAASTLSWSIAFGLTSLLIASLLVAPAWSDFGNSSLWALPLSFVGLAVLAVTADGAFTIALVWAALDITEVAMALGLANQDRARSRAVSAFAFRLVSLALAGFAHVLSNATGSEGAFDSLLLTAVAVRIAVLVAQQPAGAGAGLPGGMNAALQLSSAAATVGLLPRIGPVQVAAPFTELLLLLCAAAALYAGWTWLRAADDAAMRASWILGLASLAMASTLRGNSIGAAGWGLALVLAGGALFLATAQRTWIDRSVLLGAWCLSSLPFSIGGAAWDNPSGFVNWALPALVVAQALFIAGFLHHAVRPSRQPSTRVPASWLHGIYIAGIGFLVMIQVVLGLWGWEGALQVGFWPAGVAAASLSLLVFWGRSRLTLLHAESVRGLQRTTGAGSRLAVRASAAVQDGLQRLLRGMAEVLEGEGGIMWSLLILTLAVSLLVGGSR